MQTAVGLSSNAGVAGRRRGPWAAGRFWSVFTPAILIGCASILRGAGAARAQEDGVETASAAAEPGAAAGIDSPDSTILPRLIEPRTSVPFGAAFPNVPFAVPHAIAVEPFPTRPPALSVAVDTLLAAYLPFKLPAEDDRVSYDFDAGRIRRSLSYGSVVLEPEAVYTQSEWQAALAATSLKKARKNATVEALAASNRRVGDGITKFEIPVRFPKAIGGIIGQGVDINVTGREAISFSGESNFPIKPRATEIGGPRRFPDLDMRQQLQLNLDGTIGDKIHVQVQHDSETQTPLANRIRLRYEGYEDEVVQKIEVGNTALTLPGNNQFVSFSGRQQGLFGLKLEGKAGNLDFTTIVSKQEGRTDRESFVGQSSERVVQIPDKDFQKSRLFWATRDPGVDPFPQSFSTIRVFLDDIISANDTEQGAIPAIAAVDADTTRDDGTGNTLQRGTFTELQLRDDYTINPQLGILTMNHAIRDNEVLAIAYTFVRGPGDTVSVGVIPSLPTQTAPAVLKLLKPVNPDPNTEGTEIPKLRVTWRYQLRNVYDVGATGLQKESFELKILKRIPGQQDTDVQNGTPYIRVLGLDNVGAQAGSPADERVDPIYADCNENLPWRQLVLVDYENGLIYFPGERPFAPTAGQENLNCSANTPLEEPNPVIYERRYDRVSSTDQKYVIEVRFRAAGQTNLSLGRSNILEGSEVVRLGDKVLARGVDYRITYEIGLIEFLSEEAKRPDARVTVDFEYAPFLAQQQKSLLGVAGTYKFGTNADLSSIWLFESNKTPYRRPRIGQEPSRALVGGLSGQWHFAPTALSDLVDKLPLVTTDRGSNIAISAEAAMSVPNPNTRNNIYVDDMEGTEESSSLGAVRRQWANASLPIGPGPGGHLNFADRYQRVEWFNPKNAARRSDLNTILEGRDEGKNTITVLEIALKGGTQNSPQGTNGWGGIMRLLSKTGIDYSRRKFLEVWVNPKTTRSGILHVDLGTIPEDATWQRGVAPNGRLDTEDRTKDERLDDTGNRGPLDEDTGLDGQFNELEAPCGARPDCDPADPTSDDWHYDDNDENDYSRINGTEANGFLDTEDLDGNFILNAEESYFHYAIDLAADSVAVYGRQDAGTSWRLYRIPLRDGVAAAGAPTLDRDVKSVRVWFSGIESPEAAFQIASIEIVGNRWLEGPFLSGRQDSLGTEIVPGYGLIADTTADVGRFAVRTIDNKTDSVYFAPPIEIREINNVLEREQSLVLEFDELAASHSAYASKDLFQDEDYSRYTRLNFFYRAQGAVAGGEPWLFVRFGSDSLNFYEFRTPVSPGDWQEAMIDLAKLTQVKLELLARDSVVVYRTTTKKPYYVDSVSVAPGVIAAVGSPTLTRIGLVEFGITNRSPGGPTTGEVWVDELRLTDVRKNAGMAERFNFTVDFADLASLSAGVSRIDDNYQSLGGARSGAINTDSRINGSLNVHKLIEGTGLSIPFAWGWSGRTSLPELRTGSDVVLLDREAERTENSSLTGSVSIARSRKSKSLLMYHSIDAMRFRISGAQSNGFSPSKIDTSNSYGFGFDYGFRPRTPKDLRVFRSFRMAWFPTNIGFSASKDESEALSVDRRVLQTGADSLATRRVRNRASRSIVTVDGSPIAARNFTTKYSFSSTRDHGRESQGELLRGSGVNIGQEVGRAQSAGLTFTPLMPKALLWMVPNLSYDTQYSEALPFELGRDRATGKRLRNVRNQNSAKLSTALNLVSLFRNQGGSAGGADSTKKFNPFSGLGALGRRLQDIRTSIAVARNSGFDRVKERPDLRYQLGFDDILDPSVRDTGVAGREERFDRTKSITGSASGGVSLFRGVVLLTEYSRSESRAVQSRNQSARSSTTWPDFNASWGDLDRIGAIGKLVESASLDVGYKESHEKSGVNISQPDQETTRKEWAPLFSVAATLDNGLRANLSGNRSAAIGQSRLGSRAKSENSSSSYRMGFQYRIKTVRKVSVPLLGKGEPTAFTSELGLSLDFNLQNAMDIVRATLPGQVDNVQSNTRTWSVVPRATYGFSKNVNGQLEARYGETNNRKNENLSRRTIGMSVSATLAF